MERKPYIELTEVEAERILQEVLHTCQLEPSSFVNAKKRLKQHKKQTLKSLKRKQRH